MRSNPWIGLCTMASVLLVSHAATTAQTAESDPRWQQAAQLQKQRQYDAAATLFRTLFAEHPDSQEAALRVAICENRAGLTRQALADYQVANNVEPFGYWAEVGLYRQAVLFGETGDLDGAHRCIDLLHERFPDSRWTARGALLQAELDGLDTTEAEAALTREIAAWERVTAANQQRDRAHDEQRMQLLEAVVAEYPDTGSALQALDTIGHLQIRNGLSDDAINTFLEIINRAEMSAPQSRVVQTALSRLAGLYHAKGQKEEALELFNHLAEYGTDPKVISNSALQAAGLFFELRQAEQWRNEPVDPSDWAEVRRRCANVKALGFAASGEMVRADLMIMESYLYGGQPDACLALAEAFINSNGVPEYRREVSTAHLFAGDSLTHLSRFEEALVHFRSITGEYESGGKIWPDPYMISHAYYRVFDVLNRSGAPSKQIEAAADAVLTKFPDSLGATLVRNALQWNAKSAGS